MRERSLGRALSVSLFFFSVLALSGGSSLHAGRIERGVSCLRSGDEKKALDIFSEVWASGEDEERQLAMFYLNLVVEGGKDNIPTIEEARAAIRLKAAAARSEETVSSEETDSVKPTAVIYHNKKAKRIDEELSRRYAGGGAVSTGRKGAELPGPKPKIRYRKFSEIQEGGEEDVAGAEVPRGAAKKEAAKKISASSGQYNAGKAREGAPSPGRAAVTTADNSGPEGRPEGSPRRKLIKTVVRPAATDTSGERTETEEQPGTTAPKKPAAHVEGKKPAGAGADSAPRPSSSYKLKPSGDDTDEPFQNSAGGRVGGSGGDGYAPGAAPGRAAKPAGGTATGASAASSPGRIKKRNDYSYDPDAAPPRPIKARSSAEKRPAASGEKTEEAAEEASSPASAPYRETVTADAGADGSAGGGDLVAVGEAPAPRAKTVRTEEDELSITSSPYRETVVVGAPESAGNKVVAVASAARKKEVPQELRTGGAPAAKSFDKSAIKVRVSDETPDAPPSGYYGAQSSSVAVVASATEDRPEASDVKVVRLKGKRKTFVVEDAYAVDDEPNDEFVSEVRFKTNDLELAGDAMSALAEAVGKLSKKGTLTVRGLSSPSEKNAENLSKVRAKLVERLLKKKFDIPSDKLNVEWGIGVNQDDRKVLLLIRT